MLHLRFQLKVVLSLQSNWFTFWRNKYQHMYEIPSFYNPIKKSKTRNKSKEEITSNKHAIKMNKGYGKQKKVLHPRDNLEINFYKYFFLSFNSIQCKQDPSPLEQFGNSFLLYIFSFLFHRFSVIRDCETATIPSCEYSFLKHTKILVSSLIILLWSTKQSSHWNFTTIKYVTWNVKPKPL